MKHHELIAVPCCCYQREVVLVLRELFVAFFSDLDCVRMRPATNSQTHIPALPASPILPPSAPAPLEMPWPELIQQVYPPIPCVAATRFSMASASLKRASTRRAISCCSTTGGTTTHRRYCSLIGTKSGVVGDFWHWNSWRTFIQHTNPT